MSLLSPEIQVALTALKALRPVETELNYARKAGLELIIPAELEAEYVKEHGPEGQRYCDNCEQVYHVPQDALLSFG